MKTINMIKLALAAGIYLNVFLTGIGFASNIINENRISAELLNIDPVNTDSAVTTKPDFMVNSLTGTCGASQYSASVAADSSGNYGVTWVDYRSGNPEIYAQFYNSTGEKRGGNIKVSESQVSANSYYPAISANKRGDFVIVWNKNNYSVMGQRFSFTGEKSGANFLLNSLNLNNIQYAEVVVNEDGSFLASWSGLDESYDLYVRIFSPDNTPLFTEYKINDLMNIFPVSNGRYTAVDGMGNYVVVWSAPGSNGFSDIYLQVINREGGKVNNSIIISDNNNRTYKRTPQVACTDDGHCLVTWYNESTTTTPGGPHARIYSLKNYFTTGDMDLTYYSPSMNLSISSDRKKYFLFLYEDRRVQMIDTLGKTRGGVMQLNFTDSDVYYPAPSATDIVNGIFCAVFRFNVNNDVNVGVRRFSDVFYPAGSFEKVNDDVAGSSQQKPVVGFNNKGSSIVLWEDTRNGNKDLYGQVYDENSNPVGENVLVYKAPSENWSINDKAVSTLSDGTFVVAFSGNEGYSDSFTYLRMVTPEGTLSGMGRRVGPNSGIFNVSLNVNSNDNILICWYNLSSSFIRKFDKKGFDLSQTIRFGLFSEYYPVSAAIDTSLNVFLIWTDQNYGKGIIYGAIYNSSGEIVLAPTPLLSTTNNVSSITCALNGENYAVIWKDYYVNIHRAYKAEDGYITYNYRDTRYPWNNPDILYFERGKLLASYQVDYRETVICFDDNKEDTTDFFIFEYDPAITGDLHRNSAVYNNKIFFVYEKAGDTTAYDIWGRILDPEGFNLKNESYYLTKKDDYLFDNFPNPFNGSTTIAYRLFSPYHVKLTVYDILGREVKVLVDDFREKGIYEERFDASGLASGVYIYKLDAFKTYVKKFIILK